MKTNIRQKPGRNNWHASAKYPTLHSRHARSAHSVWVCPLRYGETLEIMSRVLLLMSFTASDALSTQNKNPCCQAITNEPNKKKSKGEVRSRDVLVRTGFMYVRRAYRSLVIQHNLLVCVCCTGSGSDSALRHWLAAIFSLFTFRTPEMARFWDASLSDPATEGNS